MNDEDDVQLQVKKKARRRLVGAIAFFAFAALVLPKVMNQAPPPPQQAVDFHIPNPQGQPFQPETAPLPPIPPEAPSAPAADNTRREDRNVARVVETVPPDANSPPRPEPKPDVNRATRDADESRRAAGILAGKPPEIRNDAQRAADILAGRSPEVIASAGPASTVNPVPHTGAPHVVLIGAFSNAANVTNLKNKLGELGIRIYTEPLGEKTRVRAGPFPDRATAERALEKMQRIGVSGVVAAR
ncbi:MAG: SPOR domain-containing protein [Zoogloeaceae bacterium]|jgi:DedD protein|nr:SPOR domain-containing protein [Zoogloeaceae bacterium]